MDTGWSRRDVLKLGSAAAAVGVLGSFAGARSLQSATAGVQPVPSGRTRMLRVAHMTDTHIQPELRAFEGVAQCLRHIQSQKDKPQIILTGGDLIMDSFDQGRPRTQELWDLWKKVMKDEVSLPIVHTLGNHDIWGWNKSKSKTKGDESGWGKKWACDMVGRDKSYVATDFQGVRIITLDSVHPDPRDANGYIGRLDDEQFAWLESTLKGTPATTPVMVVSHIPILTATCFMLGKSEVKKDDHRVGVSEMHSDMRRITDLFAKHSNVRACLSGHIHMVDRVEIRGVTYLCDGAACGAWWKGRGDRCDEGYALVDLYSDGTIEREYVAYGWNA